MLCASSGTSHGLPAELIGKIAARYEYRVGVCLAPVVRAGDQLAAWNSHGSLATWASGTAPPSRTCSIGVIWRLG
jgi:hypothetical protein